MLRSFSIFLIVVNDESFNKEIKIREGALEYVTEGIECQLIKVMTEIVQFLLHVFR